METSKLAVQHKTTDDDDDCITRAFAVSVLSVQK